MPPRSTGARTSPRKSPVQKRSKITVDVILEAAARVLAKEGAEALTTNRIAEVAGVSVGSVYQYFPNKESIVAALVDRSVEGSRSVIGALPVAGDTPLADLIRERVAILVQMALDTTRFPPDISGFVQPGAYSARLMREVVGQFLRIQEAHRAELVVADIEFAAVFCGATVRGVLMAVRQGTIPGPAERITDELTALLLRYLTGRGF